ncbi:MAG TPA: hypothetical protein VFH98_05050, partial [Candidatus Limnocylindria bacterium]|nr:hypothetical protein [Candidatus Limnocylindria bacterium]
MVIKASAAAEIRGLIEALGGSDEVMREAAVARLAVIGARAVEKLLTAYGAATTPGARLAILRTLEPIGDRRTIEVAKQAIAEGGELALAATTVLRGLLDSPHSEVAAAALDTLVETALDRNTPRHLRGAALDTIQDASPGVRARVDQALASEPDLRLNTRAPGASQAATGDALWLDLSAGRLPDDPRAVAAAVQGRAGSAALTSLQKMVDAARAMESGAKTAAARAEWRNLRGVLHQALARRGSRVALYDLREAFDQATRPLPADFLTAIARVGDESCLEPLARAW